MTNGAHPRKRGKKAETDKPKEASASSKIRKWIPAAVAKKKQSA